MGTGDDRLLRRQLTLSITGNGVWEARVADEFSCGILWWLTCELLFVYNVNLFISLKGDMNKMNVFKKKSQRRMPPSTGYI